MGVGAGWDNGVVTPSTEHRIETAMVRRSPRYGIFLVLGAALGIVAALVLTFAFDGSAQKSPSTQAQYSLTQVFGFLCLVAIPVGMALMAVVALLLDRRFARRAREVQVDHERIDVAVHDQDAPDSSVAVDSPGDDPDATQDASAAQPVPNPDDARPA